MQLPSSTRLSAAALACLASLLLGTPAAAAETGHGHDPDDDHSDDPHLAERDGLRIVHAWSRASKGPEAVVFLEIENQGAADTLVAATSDQATAIVIEGLRLVAGELVGEPLGDVPIPAGGTFHFEPDVAQLRLVDLDHALDQGDAYDIELVFADRGSIAVHVEVEAADATQHSHAGHSH